MSANEIVTQTILTCPQCGFAAALEIPADT